MGEFENPLSGRCRHTSFFILNDRYGRYIAECSFGDMYGNYVFVDKIIEGAKEQNMPIRLEGEIWEKVGKKDGELVKPEEAVLLVSKLRKKLTLEKLKRARLI